MEDQIIFVFMPLVNKRIIILFKELLFSNMERFGCIIGSRQGIVVIMNIFFLMNENYSLAQEQYS